MMPLTAFLSYKCFGKVFNETMRQFPHAFNFAFNGNAINYSLRFYIGL